MASSKYSFYMALLKSLQHDWLYKRKHSPRHFMKKHMHQILAASSLFYLTDIEQQFPTTITY